MKTLVGTVLTGVAISICAASPSGNEKPIVTAAQLADVPLTIAVNTDGRFAKGRSWSLSVNSARQAELTIENVRDSKRRTFEITKEQFEEFRKALLETRFFELDGVYGQRVPDGSDTSITVVAGRYSNSVKIRYLMNWVHNDKTKLVEPSRAVRLMVMVRGWFDDPDAVDLRKYDQMVLDAVKAPPG